MQNLIPQGNGSALAHLAAVAAAISGLSSGRENSAAGRDR
jgi:hypothetical protein